MTQAWLYDGYSAVRQTVDVEAHGGSLRVVSQQGLEWVVDVSSLFHAETRADHEVYGTRDIPGWRLGLPLFAADSLEDLLPRRQVYGGVVDRLGLVPALLIGALISSAVLFAGFRAPALLAPLVPWTWEKRFGDALVGDLGNKTCASSEGQAALDKLTLALARYPERVKVRVADIHMVNAVALPGGTIVIFRGLLAEAEHPDEVAGVLAHEIAHVESRHVTQAMIRHFGLGVVIASFGGNTGASIETLMAARYSRDAESEADAGAIASLRQANISPAGTATFFERLATMERRYGRISGALEYLSSHPLSEDRRQRFRASADPRRKYAPSLSEQDWGALQDICFKPRPARPVRR